MKKTNALRLLDQAKIPYDTVAYTYDENDLNVAHIAAENQLTLAHIYKTLVLQNENDEICLALVPGDKQLSLKKIAAAFRAKKVHMAPVKDLQKLTGYIRGGCSPLGMKKAFPTFIDLRAQSLDKIYLNAGIRGLLFGIAPQNFIDLSQTQVIDLCE